MKTFLKWVLYALIALFIIIQLIPYGHDHTNPPVVSEPQWDGPRTRELAVAACFDCHSNESVWPWYSNIAPVSWLVYRDVIEGREYLNFSDWANCRGEGCSPGEMAEAIFGGYMPPANYLITHPEARLTDAEKQELVTGLRNSQ
jgi:hypothetical protein